MPPVWIGLTLAFASAVVTNTAYSLEHDAAARLPPLSPRRPFRSVQVLLRDRRWLIAFGAESAGWLMYVAALRLAPLALVQAVAASGVAVLAFRTARGHPSRLARREQVAVVLAIAGLVLLALSLVDTSESDQHPTAIGIIIWLAACAGGAALLIAIPTRFGRAASLGLAAGLLFADGDISAKLIGYGGVWLLALITLIVAYTIGTSVLQWAYQRGDALTAAGTATMVTNAVPIAAGFVLFGESLPHGARAVLQVAAFACLVAGAVALGHQQPPQAAKPVPPAETGPKALRALYLGTGYTAGVAADLEAVEKDAGEMVAVNQDTGAIEWDTPIPSSPYGAATVTNDVVFTTTFHGDLFALNAGTGQILLKTPLSAGSNAPVAVDGDCVIAGAGASLVPSQQRMIIAYKLGATGKLPDTVDS
jgi:drug/metabolite transporter (DMT)-like permease